MTPDIEKRHLRGLAKLAAAVSHKLNNDLSGVTCNLSLLVEEIDDGSPLDDIREVVADALASAGRASALLHQTFGLYRLDTSGDEELELGAVVREVFEVELESMGDPCRLERRFAGEVVVRSSPERIQQMVAPLVRNAIEAVSGGIGGLEFEVRAESLREGSTFLDALPAGLYARVAVRDGGAGFDSELGVRAFEPFVSTKGPGRGLGLALSHAHALAHGGSISYRNLSDGGAEVEIWLPISVPRGRDGKG